MRKNQVTAQMQVRKRKQVTGIEGIYVDQEFYAEEGIGTKEVTYVVKGNYAKRNMPQGKTVAQV